MKQPFKASFDGSGPGEDVAFCRRVKQANYKLMVDFDVWCDHMVTVHANKIANAYMEIVNRAFDETSG